MPNLNKGLVGWWTFDGKDFLDPTHIKDTSTNGNIGTVSSGIRKLTGKLGQALSGSGTSAWVNTGNAASLQVDTGTLSLWLKGSSLNDDGQHNLIQKANAYGIFMLGGLLETYSWGGSAGFRNTNINIRDNKWHHIVMSFQSGVTNGTIFYVDGVQRYLTTITISDQLGSFDIGGANLLGSLDDVRVYSRVLSVSEVQQLYKQGGGVIVNKPETAKPNLNSGLVGWWTFDGKETTAVTTTDKSRNGIDGTRISVTSVAGKIGQAMKFNGTTSKITLPSFTTGATLTLAGWFKTTSNDQQSIVNNYWDSRGLYFGTVGGKMFSYSTYNSPEAFQGNAIIKDNKWHLGVYTLNGTKGRFYVDGILDKEIDQTRTTFTLAGAIGFGMGSPDYFNGLIDDVRVYNRALSAQEVQQLYKQGGGIITSKSETTKPNLNSGLVGHWTFDGKDWASPTVVLDKSVNKNNGTLNGGVTRVSGKFGQAMKLNGTNGFITSATTGFPTSSAAISFWAKVVNPASNTSIIYSGPLFNIHFPGWGGIYWDFGSTASGGRLSIAWDASWTNKWAFWTFTSQDGVGQKIFRNGIVIASDNDTATSSYGATFWIGDLPGYDSWDGTLDDLRIYNRALSTAEVTQLYKMGK
ncbi:MAG: LamG domain-containing protein [Patescibacteria group bacterium]